MKNASKHADELKALLKKLIKETKPAPKEPTDALHALVRGAMSFDVPDSRADEAMKAIDREFVDLNELRVATDLEIQEMLGSRYPQIEKRVAMITQALNNIFEREHTLSLERLKTIPKKDARAFLRELPDIHPFVESYVMLFALEGACVPTDSETVTVLTEHGVLEPDTSLEEAQKFIEHAVKADECYEAYVSLRRLAAESSKAKKKKGTHRARNPIRFATTSKPNQRTSIPSTTPTRSAGSGRGSRMWMPGADISRSMKPAAASVKYHCIENGS